MKAEGVRFRSETDSEVLSQLIGRYYTDGDLTAAVRGRSWISRVPSASR